MHICARLCERACKGFRGTIYLQLSLWEMAGREGRGAWEDLHSASRVILSESSTVCGYIHTVCRVDAAENRSGRDCKEKKKSLLLYIYERRARPP